MTKVLQFAGHGGDNWGITYAGVVEKELTLEIANDLHSVFRLWDVESVLGRKIDEEIKLEDRGLITREQNPNLVLCHHVNGMFRDIYNEAGDLVRKEPVSSTDGIMCFVLSDDRRGYEVAEAMSRCAPKSLLRRKYTPYIATPHDWTRRAYNVLYPHRGRPAVLIEWGFLTAPRDRLTLTDPSSRPAMLACGLAGLSRFFEVYGV